MHGVSLPRQEQVVFITHPTAPSGQCPQQPHAAAVVRLFGLDQLLNHGELYDFPLGESTEAQG